MGLPFEHLAQLYRDSGGSPHAARSTVYAHFQSLDMLALLDMNGLYRDGRDSETGRKIASIVREIARLTPPGTLSDWTDDQRAEMIAIYKKLRGDSLAEVRRVCRAVLNAE
jgi:hypothetical protein